MNDIEEILKQYDKPPYDGKLDLDELTNLINNYQSQTNEYVAVKPKQEVCRLEKEPTPEKLMLPLGVLAFGLICTGLIFKEIMK